jgi:hypothetical protein
MFSPSIELTKDGALLRVAGGTDPYELDSFGDLLHIWHWRLEAIDAEFTLGDLVGLLRRIRGIGLLSFMIDAPLDELFASSAGEGGGEELPPLRFLEVYNAPCPTRYEPDPDHPDEPIHVIGDEGESHELPDSLQALFGSTGDDLMVGVTSPDPVTGRMRVCRITGPEVHGVWGGPFQVIRGLRGWGPPPARLADDGDDDVPHEIGYGLFFAVIPELAHLPLRYNPSLTLASGEAYGDGLVEHEIAITVGELIYSVLWWLTFNGTPEERVAMRSAVRASFGDFDMLEQGGFVPWI